MVGNGAEAEMASGSGAGSIAGSGGEAEETVEEEEEAGGEEALHLHGGGGAAGTCAPFPGEADRWAMGRERDGDRKGGGGNDLIRLDLN